MFSIKASLSWDILQLIEALFLQLLSCIDLMNKCNNIGEKEKWTFLLIHNRSTNIYPIDIST